MKIIAILMLLACVVLVVDHVVTVPRGCPRDFDPQRMAYFEAASWRAYYERRPITLFRYLFGAAREQLQVSYLSAMQLGYNAAQSAIRFAPKGSQKGSTLPYLVSYYQTLASSTSCPIDVHAAAQAELDWWYARRNEGSEPREWVELIAEVASHVYRLPLAQARVYAELKVAAMRLRDERGAAVSEHDWQTIERTLTESWGSLKQQVD